MSDNVEYIQPTVDKDTGLPVQDLYTENTTTPVSQGEAVQIDDIVKKRIIESTIIGGKYEYGMENNIIRCDSINGFWAGHADYASAPFKIGLDGTPTFANSLSLTSLIIADAVSATTSPLRIQQLSSTPSIVLTNQSSNPTNGELGGLAVVNNELKICSETSPVTWDDINTRTDTYVAGESITAGRVVSVINKNQTWDSSTSIESDAYVSQYQPTTNFGSQTDGNFLGKQTINTTVYNFESYFKFNFAATPAIPDTPSVDKILLNLFFDSNHFSTPRTIQLRLITSTWAVGTVTYNTKPTIATFAYNEYSMGTSFSGYKEFDITEMWYQMYRNNTDTSTDYGFIVEIKERSSLGGNEYIKVYGGNSTSSDKRPYIIMTRNDQMETNPLYLADATDYRKCKNIVGIARNSGTAGADIKVQRLAPGTSYFYGTDTLTIGQRYYLTSSTGTLSSSDTSALPLGQNSIYIGTAKTVRELVFSSDYSQKLIRKYTFVPNSVDTSASIYFPSETRMIAGSFGVYFNSAANYHSGAVYAYKNGPISGSCESIHSKGTLSIDSTSRAYCSGSIEPITTSTLTDNTSNYYTFYFYE